MPLRSLVAAFVCIALGTGSLPALADPGNGKNKDPGTAQQGPGGAPGHGHEKGNGHGKGSGHDQGNGQAHEHPVDLVIDRQHVLGTLGSYREYWHPAPALPPGIQKNLARGKPLPPGIAKQLDRRLLDRLPHYEGYEWQQVGSDLVLVAIATGIIYEVLDHAFD